MNAFELATEITRPTMWGRSPLVLDMASEGVVDTVGVARIGADPLPPEMLPAGAICGTAAGPATIFGRIREQAGGPVDCLESRPDRYRYVRSRSRSSDPDSPGMFAEAEKRK